MKTGKILFGILLVMALSVLACSLPNLTATDEPATPEDHPPLQTSEVAPSGALPLPGGLVVIPSPSLVFVDFQDENNGWGISTSGSGNILRTQDGGSTWLDVTPADLPEASYSARLFLLDVNTAWALIPGDDFNSGTLYSSLDGGASWTSNPVPFSWGDLQFLDASTGRILADRGAGAGSNAVELYQTSDGGTTWTSVFHNDPSQPGSWDSLPLGGMKSGMTFLDPDTGWVTGSRPMEGDIYLFVTHDGGRSWNSQPVSIPAELVECQFNTYPPIFFGEDGFLPIQVNCYFDLVEQVFYVTHDSGATWGADPTDPSQVVIPPGHYVFTDALHGFSWNGGAEIIRTSDGAQTWIHTGTSLHIPDTLHLIDFIDENTGWALATDWETETVELYQTRDGGITWLKLLP